MIKVSNDDIYHSSVIADLIEEIALMDLRSDILFIDNNKFLPLIDDKIKEKKSFLKKINFEYISEKNSISEKNFNKIKSDRDFVIRSLPFGNQKNEINKIIETLDLIKDGGQGVFFIYENLLYQKSQLNLFESMEKKGFYTNSLLRLPKGFVNATQISIIMMFVSKENFSQIYIESLITEKSASKMIPKNIIDIVSKKVRKDKIDLSFQLKTDFTRFSLSDMQLQEIIFNKPDMVEGAYEKFNKILNQDGLGVIKNGELNFNIYDEKFAEILSSLLSICDIQEFTVDEKYILSDILMKITGRTAKKFLGIDEYKNLEGIYIKRNNLRIDEFFKGFNHFFVEKEIYESFIGDYKNFRIATLGELKVNSKTDTDEDTIQIPVVDNKIKGIEYEDIFVKMKKISSISLKKSMIDPNYLINFLNTDLGKKSYKLDTDIDNILIPLPPIDKQKEIGLILDKLEVAKKGIEKIEKNISINPLSSSDIEILDQILSNLNSLSEADEIKNLSKKDETEILEFKSSFKLDVDKFNKTGKIIENKGLQHRVLKNIGSFLNNPRGGILLIGVNDDKKIIGMNQEIDSFYKGKDDNFNNSFKDFITKNLGYDSYNLIEAKFVNVENLKVFKVDCKFSEKKVYINEHGIDKFPARVGPSSELLQGREADKYIETRKYKTVSKQLDK